MKEDIITDYLLGQLTDAEMSVFEQQLLADPTLRQEVEELRSIWQTLQSTEKEPDTAMDTAFYKALEGEKKLKEKTPSQPFVAIQKTKFTNLSYYARYAAAVAGIGVAFWMGRQTAPVQVEYRNVVAQNEASAPVTAVKEVTIPKELTENIATPNTAPANMMQEIASLRREMKMTQELVILGLLKDQSASERLKGINYVATLEQPKPAVIEALIKTLRSDESLNVRLSTIETLERFRQETQVRTSLVAQLEKTDEPLEQTALIESLVRMRVRESLPVFDKLQKDEKTDEGVRLLARNSASELAMLTE
ncbi:MAG: hypothetical protein MUE30_17535 [Spirosomaceae bacterium]|jgi:hypothetical protein|nr:hypothetical protein [Spirosomataceae bacterium]